MIPLPALPLPKIQGGLDAQNAKTFCRVFGIALVAQWFLPWGGSAWSWSMFGATLWPLLAGAALTALSFINSPSLKLGHYVYAAAGAGVVGILYSFASAGAISGLAGAGAANPDTLKAVYSFILTSSWPFNAMGLVGIAAACIASFYWLRNGYSQFVFIMMIVSLSGFVLGLLIPYGGELPLIMIFKALSGPIVPGIFFMVLSLGYLAIIVNWVLQVFLKKENADPEQVERHALVLFFYPFVASILVGFLTFFSGFPNALHAVVVNGSFLWLAIWGVSVIVELKNNDGLKDLMTTDA
ncbi:MAG: hypothetical protein IT385_15600 [Deltaproteobacteria bacterium]|nr:hypothetical protein [Deltaproteobacteria bacterium]